MAQLPPDGEWLVQTIGTDTVIFHPYTEEEIVRVPSDDADANARAQGAIHFSDRLTDEQKSFAHFWMGYFYAYATGGRDE